MKTKLLFSLIFSLSFCSLSAQYAVVVDDGGFANIYDKEKEELDRLGSDGVVAITKDEGDEWVIVDYTKYGEYAASSGYIKKAKLVDISTYEELPIVEETKNYIILGNADFQIKLTAEEFVKEENSITYFSENNTDVVTAINGAPFWGTKVGLPTTKYNSISFTQGGEEIQFPDESFFNMFNPHLSLTKAFYDREKDIVYCYSTNGDASHPYVGLWVVEFGEYAIHYIFD